MDEEWRSPFSVPFVTRRALHKSHVQMSRYSISDTVGVVLMPEYKDAFYLIFTEGVTSDDRIYWTIDNVDRRFFLGTPVRKSVAQYYHEGNQALVWVRYNADVTGQGVSAKESIKLVARWFNGDCKHVDLST